MKTRWLIIGSGRVARALAAGLAARGERVEVAGRRRPARQGLAAEVRLSSWKTAATPRGDVVLLAVPDAAIADSARALAGRLGHAGRGTGVVLHTSGSRPETDLAPLAENGWATGIFHVVAPFPPPGSAFAWEGRPAGITGAPPARRAARRLAALLGSKSFPLPGRDRAGYHLGLSLAAAGIVGLVDLAADRLAAAGIGKRLASRLAVELASSALSEWGARRDLALTGAVARGDAPLVASHLDACRGPEERELVRILWERTLTIAERSGRLSPSLAKALSRLLRR